MKPLADLRVTVKIILVLIALPLALCLALLLFVVAPIGIAHYCEARMVVPIEWAGDVDSLRGTKITADFIEMRSSSRMYSHTRKFVIGKTEKFALPHSLHMFDGDSVKPQYIRLTLSDGEFLTIRRWNEKTQKWECTGNKVVFYVEAAQNAQTGETQ